MPLYESQFSVPSVSQIQPKNHTHIKHLINNRVRLAIGISSSIFTLTILQFDSITIEKRCTIIACSTRCIVPTFETFAGNRIAWAFFIWINITRTLARLTDLIFDCRLSIITTSTSLTLFARITFATCAVNSVTVFGNFTARCKADWHFLGMNRILDLKLYGFLCKWSANTYLLLSIGNGHAQIIQSFGEPPVALPWYPTKHCSQWSPVVECLQF